MAQRHPGLWAIRRSALAAAAVLAATPTIASATPTIDVDNYRAFDTPGDYRQFGTYYHPGVGRVTTVTLLQSWTTGRAGILAGIDIFGEVSGGAPVYLDVFAGGNSTSPSFRESDLLGQVTASFPAAGPDRPPFYPIAFDLRPLAILADAGDRFTFQVRVGQCDGCGATQLFTYLWNSSTHEPVPVYAGGAMFLRVAPMVQTTGQDANFRTFMAPPPGAVPEPATWALLVLGFGAAGAALRRRSAVASLVPGPRHQVQDPVLELQRPAARRRA